MLHLLLNLCAFCRLASRLAWDRRPCPAPAPAPAQTAPARPAGETASRHGTRAARPATYRRRRTTRPAPRPDGHAAPMPSTRPPRSNRQSQPETARTSEEEEEEHERRQGEKMRTCARLPAVLPSKSYINRTPPPNGQPSTAPGQQAPQPAPAEAPSLPTFSRPFSSLSILLLESLQNPGPFSPVSRRTTAPPPACLDATGTGGAFTFSRPLRFSRNGSVPPLYHVRPISPFFTREQSRRFPNSK